MSPAPARRRPLSAGSLLFAVSRHRTLLAAGLVAASVAAGLSAVTPAPEARVEVMAAARDLPSGAVLAADDLVAVALPPGAVPSGALHDADVAVGRLVSGPVRRGEALTDVRLLGDGLLTGSDGVAVPVRLADPATAALVQAGDRVDVLSAPPEGASAASTVAAGVTVLAVPVVADDPGEGALVVVAAPSAVAARLAAAAVTGRLSVAVRSR